MLLIYLTSKSWQKNLCFAFDIFYNNLQEVEVIDGIKKALQTRIGDAFEQLCLLQEARQQIQADLQDKNIALGIDVDQYNLTDRSSNISFKPDSLRVPKG